jgi:hypothetical protein
MQVWFAACVGVAGALQGCVHPRAVAPPGPEPVPRATTTPAQANRIASPETLPVKYDFSFGVCAAADPGWWIANWTQRDSYHGAIPPRGKTRPLPPPIWAVLWLEREAVNPDWGDNAYLTRLGGHPLVVPPSEKAIYSLQQDFALLRIPLSEAEVDHVLSLLKAEDEPPPMAKGTVFDDKVRPMLVRVRLTSSATRPE